MTFSEFINPDDRTKLSGIAVFLGARITWRDNPAARRSQAGSIIFG